jgi:hypothetical protein
LGTVVLGTVVLGTVVLAVASRLYRVVGWRREKDFTHERCFPVTENFVPSELRFAAARAAVKPPERDEQLSLRPPNSS